MSDTRAPHPELPAPIAAPISMVEPQETRQWYRWAALVLSVVCAGAAWTAWNAQQRVKALEQELVKRQADSQSQSAEARVLARQAQELSREAAARAAMLETRLAEVALQRGQVEDLIKSFSLSRDENLIVDIDSTLRVAIQQSALTGSADPLMQALQSADDRLANAKQPRLDNIRRAIAKDLDRVRATRIADLSSMVIRLDEAVRLVDDAPLISQAQTAGDSAIDTRPLVRPVNDTAAKAPPAKASKAASAPVPAAASAASSGGTSDWLSNALLWAQGATHGIWAETKALVRVTRIARPEAMLVSPEQGFFLRENLKLRLLNARLALLSRQTTTAMADIQVAQAAIKRYFDTQSRKTELLQGMLSEIASQSPQTLIPRPDDTLAALAAVAGRTR